MTPDHVDMRDAVLAWYRSNGRPLAFRRTSDPWAILVSEFMAQQTQAARAAEAWERFLVEYPTPEALAAASPADVLRAWRGLGYNRRALALRAAAISIVDDHGGRVPRDLEALDALPGVGPYTARAVAALAYGARVGAVDTNVRRVLSRALFGSGSDSPGAIALQAAADDLVPAEGPGEWTHALMDVGATFCKPRPRCEACPARTWCKFAEGAAVRGATPLAAGVAAAHEAARAEGVEFAAGAPRPSPRPRAAASGTFERTSRWLRGRILDRLRDAESGAWVEIVADGLGDHDATAIGRALAALSREGLVELAQPSQTPAPASARLPLA